MNICILIDKIHSTSNGYPDIILSDSNKIYTFVNPYKYHFVRKNEEVFLSMDGIMVDGILMCKFIKWFWGYNIPRLSFDMTTIAKDLFPRINNNGSPIYFIGDSQEMIEKAVSRFKESFPQMNVVGFHNGFFKSYEDKMSIINEIISLKPTYTIVGMGAIIQENFAADLKKAGYSGIVFTCGGYFHQAANSLYYYPEWINKLNIRIIYRMIKEKTYKRVWHVLIFTVLFTYDTILSKCKDTNRI